MDVRPRGLVAVVGSLHDLLGWLGPCVVSGAGPRFFIGLLSRGRGCRAGWRRGGLPV